MRIMTIRQSKEKLAGIILVHATINFIKQTKQTDNLNPCYLLHRNCETEVDLEDQFELH